MLLLALVGLTAGTAQAHEGACVETVNPHGATVPPAGFTTLPGPKGGQNEDGFYQLLILLPEPGITSLVVVLDTGSGTTFGPFPSGTNIKYTQAPGAAPSIKKIGSTNGQAGAVEWHITGTGDFVVFATTNPDVRVSCLVPPPPK